MNLTEDQFDRIIAIARLKITPDKKARLFVDLRRMLEQMEIFDKLEVDPVDAAMSIMRDQNVIEVD